VQRVGNVVDGLLMERDTEEDLHIPWTIFSS